MYVKFKQDINKIEFPYILEDYSKILNSEEYFKIVQENEIYIQVKTKFGIKLFKKEDIIERHENPLKEITRYYKVKDIIDLEDFPYANSPEEYKKLLGKIGKFDKFINKEIIQLEFKDALEDKLLFIFNIWDVENIKKIF